jgi:hypothetical protein
MSPELDTKILQKKAPSGILRAFACTYSKLVKRCPICQYSSWLGFWIPILIC